jgi:hypothetical protein
MSFQFLVEVDRATPKYASRLIQNSDVVSIYPTRSEEIVLAGDHRDDVYKYFLRKCTELDCTQFYSTGLATGAVSLCQECEEFIPRGRGGGVGSGIPCQGYSRIENFGSLEDNQNLRVTNGSSAEEALSKAESYNTWKNSSTTNRLVANSGSWLGIDECVGGIWQCAVNCATGNTTACWSIEVELDEFGTIYTLNGAKYQIYDPLQIALAGVVSNGGTLPLVSSNPFFGLEINAQYPSLDDPENTFCGVPVTVFGGGGSDSNCLTGESCPDCPNDYAPIPSTSNDVFPQEVALIGDYTDKILTVGNNCYNLSADPNTRAASGVFGLGGNGTIEPSTEEELGVTNSSDSCGNCIGDIVSAGGGPDCCNLACGGIVINGAPEWNGSSWTPGSGSWNGFWPTHSDDQNYRNIEDDEFEDQRNFPGENRHIWHGSTCTRQNTANSLYSVPCSYQPTNTCSNGETKITAVLKIFDATPKVSPCICTDISVGGTCKCVTVDETTGQQSCGIDSLDDPCSSVGITAQEEECREPTSRKIPLISPNCEPCPHTTKNTCDPVCNIFFLNQPSSIESFRADTVSNISAVYGLDCTSVSGLIQEQGCTTSATISGVGVKHDTCNNTDSCTSGSVSGFIDTAVIADLIKTGRGSAGVAPVNGSCCYESISSPVSQYTKLICTSPDETDNWFNRKGSNPDCKTC